MAYQFAQSPSHGYLRTVTAPTLTAELALSLWFKVADTTNHHTLFKLEFDDPDNNRLMIQARGDVAGDPVRFVSQREGTLYEVLSTGSYTANVWQHVMVATGFAAGNVWIGFNGAAWVHRDGVKPPNGNPSYVQIGGDNAFIPAAIGSIAEVALWNALAPFNSFDPQGQGKPLTQGFDPGIAHANKPVFHAPLDGRLQDIRGGRTLTAYNGAVPANDHPPMRR